MAQHSTVSLCPGIRAALETGTRARPSQGGVGFSSPQAIFPAAWRRSRAEGNQHRGAVKPRQSETETHGQTRRPRAGRPLEPNLA